MRNDLNEIRKLNKKFAFADKSLNIYKIEPKYNKKLLEEKIIAIYKKCDSNAVEIVFKKEAQKIISNLKTPGKIQKLQQDAFITLKDHKPGFPNKSKCRVINPFKKYSPR